MKTKSKNQNIWIGGVIALITLALVSTPPENENINSANYNSVNSSIDNTIDISSKDIEEEKKEEPGQEQEEIKKEETVVVKTEEKEPEDEPDQEPEEQKEEPVKKEEIKLNAVGYNITNNTLTYKNKEYKIINVYGGDRSGYRAKNVAVDIGYGDRKYYGLTNEYGQLKYVLAEKIVLQDDSKEDVNKNGRYYDDEANVPGTEKANLDQGHIIADSLGGVANAYNITPQDSVLNRHGDQAYMEKVIRDAGGCSLFVATITYKDTKTQTPSKYRYEYILRGNKIVDEFKNENPEGSYTSNPTTNTNTNKNTNTNTNTNNNNSEDVSKIDTNGNGQVTIKEAKAAGFKMPISSSHWLYKYMIDGDGDGLVGE